MSKSAWLRASIMKERADYVNRTTPQRHESIQAP